MDKRAVFTGTVFSRPCLCLISTVYHTTFSFKKKSDISVSSILLLFPWPAPMSLSSTSLNLSLPVSDWYLLFWRGLSWEKMQKCLTWEMRRCYAPVNSLLDPFPGPRKEPVPNLSISSPSGYICPCIPVSSKMFPSTPGNLPVSCLTGWCQQPWLVPCLASTHGSFSHWLPE